MIDWGHVRELRDQIGVDEFAEVVELFLDEIEEAVGLLSKQLKLETLEQDLHFLKGTALNLGFRDLGQFCQIGENLARDGRLEEIELAPLLACYKESRSVFIQQLDQGLAA